MLKTRLVIPFRYLRTPDALGGLGGYQYGAQLIVEDVLQELAQPLLLGKNPSIAFKVPNVDGTMQSVYAAVVGTQTDLDTFTRTINFASVQIDATAELLQEWIKGPPTDLGQWSLVLP